MLLASAAVLLSSTYSSKIYHITLNTHETASIKQYVKIRVEAVNLKT